MTYLEGSTRSNGSVRLGLAVLDGEARVGFREAVRAGVQNWSRARKLAAWKLSMVASMGNNEVSPFPLLDFVTWRLPPSPLYLSKLFVSACSRLTLGPRLSADFWRCR